MPYRAKVFECQQCGECCKGFGGTYVSDADIRAIAEYLGEDLQGFTDRYCQPSGSRWVLAQAEDGYCVFCQDRRCRIHPVKPRMCRQWPFISSVLQDIGNWYIMANFCPGMRTDLPESAIVDAVRQALKQ